MRDLTKLKKFLSSHSLLNTQAFRVPNAVGDPMTTLYEEDGVKVNYCFYYDYLEIFGLTNEEWEEISYPKMFGTFIKESF